ncbi:MAG: oligoendopeptidase F [Mollicutes bacterium]|nr:oligoendopeptidase F [Mollicutes bacterium]
MVKEEKLRSEIDSKYKWDLESLYKSDNDWEKEYEEVDKKIDKLAKYKNKVLESANNLLQVTKLYLDLDRKVNKLYAYAHMHNDEETFNPHYQALKGKIENLVTKFFQAIAFYQPELLKESFDQILEYIEELPELKEYEFYFEKIYRFKKHVLSEKEEEIISSMYKIMDNPNKTANLLRNSDLKLGTIIDEDGNSIELSDSNFSLYIQSPNREVRKQAFYTMYNGYASVKNTLASTLAGKVESNIVIAKLRGYKDARSMALYQDNIDLKIYDNLLETVNKNLNVLHKYYRLKKDILGLSDFSLYDINVNLIKDSEKEYSFEEAKEIVINALSILGEDYITSLKKAFAERWIDVYPNKGKKSGAYSLLCYDSPFVFLNYQGRLDDIRTLAHELGHSMHSYYSKKNNPYHYFDYSIFVAEVVSAVNELLLCYYLLNNSNDKNIKLTILNKMLDLVNSKIYRQTLFAEFEKIIYEKATNGEILTHELLSNIYYDLNVKYFGSDVIVNNEIRYEWERIPHFYMNFYVYQYATGLSAACAIVNKIFNNEKGAIDNYLEFLKSSGRDYPISLLKIAGVDMTKPKVIESAIKMFDETIDKFIKLYNS